jgi:two-component system response regulator AlgR
MRVLVVDDEPLARQRLRALLGEVAPQAQVSEAANGAEALSGAGQELPDVVLLDIRMPGIDGLEVARHLAGLPAPPAVVFTTAYDQHALDAFEARAVDYLLKPVRAERLGAALARAQALRPTLVARADAREARRRTHLCVSGHGGLELVPVAEIRYLCAEHKYVTIGTPGGERLTEEPLKDLEAELGESFLRVHRSALVALAHVTGLARDAEGHHRVRLAGVSREIEVSRRLLPAVRRQIRGRQVGSGRSP